MQMAVCVSREERRVRGHDYQGERGLLSLSSRVRVTTADGNTPDWHSIIYGGRGISSITKVIISCDTSFTAGDVPEPWLRA